jgi:hypothetical protein
MVLLWESGFLGGGRRWRAACKPEGEVIVAFLNSFQNYSLWLSQCFAKMGGFSGSYWNVFFT